jgi:RimJ/RimL family protein N-acetyltransferase
MDEDRSLFEGRLITLAPLDPDQDAEVESRWTHDADYLRLFSQDVARPLAPARLKKKYTDLEKRIEESGNQFYFTLRLREPGGEASSEAEKPGETGRLLGFVHILWISWNSGTASISLGIGDPADRGKGYGSEALGMALRYAFAELNLHRLEAIVPEYNQAALRLFERAGFVPEVRQRQALARDGRRWDLLRLGILKQEWEENPGSDS